MRFVSEISRLRIKPIINQSHHFLSASVLIFGSSFNLSGIPSLDTLYAVPWSPQNRLLALENGYKKKDHGSCVQE